jgi:hypothetical protein
MCLLFAPLGRAQAKSEAEEIPLKQCDRLPVVTVRVDKADMSFLVDTAATSLLNPQSFSSGRSGEIHIASWTGTTVTSACEVAIPELAPGNRKLRHLKLPAVDLSPMVKACGGPIDGILGVDLLEQLGMTIDLQRRVARLALPPADPAERSLISEMEKAMHDCPEAFNSADKEKLEACFDRDLVLRTPWGEYRGPRESCGIRPRAILHLESQGADRHANPRPTGRQRCCLEFVRLSHRLPRYPHRRPGNDGLPQRADSLVHPKHA